MNPNTNDCIGLGDDDRDRGISSNLAGIYVYKDHSHERADPFSYDPCFESMLQTADRKRKLPAKLSSMLQDPGKKWSA